MVLLLEYFINEYHKDLPLLVELTRSHIDQALYHVAGLTVSANPPLPILVSHSIKYLKSAT